MFRLSIAVTVGVGIAVAAAIVLGDYPFSGSVPWVAAILIPAIVGVPMAALDRRHRTSLWVGAGPLSAGSLAWGAVIATGWGIDPFPAVAWASIALALVWPPLLGLSLVDRRVNAPSAR